MCLKLTFFVECASSPFWIPKQLHSASASCRGYVFHLACWDSSVSHLHLRLSCSGSTKCSGSQAGISSHLQHLLMPMLPRRLSQPAPSQSYTPFNVTKYRVWLAWVHSLKTESWTRLVNHNCWKKHLSHYLSTNNQEVLNWWHFVQNHQTSASSMNHEPFDI